MMAKYFEDFAIGDKFISPGRTITETDVVLFSGLSGDYNPLHTNSEFAKETIFGERVVHGLLGLSIVSGLSARLGIFDGTIIAFLGIEKWEFTKPILLNDTVHLEMTIIDKRETSKNDRGILYREVKLFNQHGDIVQQGVLPVMIKKKSFNLQSV